MTDRIVIITGGRDLTDRSPVWAFLDEQLAIAKSEKQWLVVFEGGCVSGADQFAREWHATASGRKHYGVTYPPDIAKHGVPAAFHIRNRKMVSDAVGRREIEGGDLIAGAFPGKGNGTRETIKLLKKAGVETRVVEGCK